MASAKDLAKRVLVTLIRFLAGVYAIAVVVKRESTDEDVGKAYRTLSRTVHPDRGGLGADQHPADPRPPYRTAGRKDRKAERPKGQGCKHKSKTAAAPTGFLLAAIGQGQHLDGPLPRYNSSFSIKKLISKTQLTRSSPERTFPIVFPLSPLES